MTDAEERFALNQAALQAENDAVLEEMAAEAAAEAAEAAAYREDWRIHRILTQGG